MRKFDYKTFAVSSVSAGHKDQAIIAAITRLTGHYYYMGVEFRKLYKPYI